MQTRLATLLPPEGMNLTSMPGISTVLAAKITAYTNGIHRFANRDKFLQYAGIGLLEKSSGKKKRFRQNNKGNRLLNHAIYFVSLNRLIRHQQSQAYYQKKLKEGKSKKHALRCLMKRVGSIVYGMLKSGEDYRE